MRFEPAHDKSRRGAQYVMFRFGPDYYGIAVAKVREILRPLDLFPVPGMGSGVEGVINLRGEIIPMVKLALLLGLERAESDGASRKRRMIIIDAPRGSFGFLVDEVLEVTRIQSEEIQPPPDLGRHGAGGEVATGIAKVSGRMVVCIDPERLITDDLVAKELAIDR
jgi:chemotaxis signal transduction protein